MMYVKSTNGKTSIFIVFNKLGIHAMVAYRFKCKQNNDDHETAEYIYLKTKGEIRSLVETDENGRQHNVQFIACTNKHIKYIYFKLKKKRCILLINNLIIPCNYSST